MSQLYTQAQRNTITSFRYRVYVDNSELAPLAAEDLAFTNAPNLEAVGSAMTGETPIAHINKGTAEATLSFTVEGFNKAILQKVFKNQIDSGSTALDVDTPYTGSLEGRSTPGRAKTSKVVAILYYTDENGVDKPADASITTLPCNILMPQAVATDGLDQIFNPTSMYKYTVTFTGEADVVNDRVWVMDDGIATDGTYTP